MKPAPAEDARRGLQAFIRAQGPADAVLEEVASLRSEESDGFKALGYGAPVRVRFRSADGAQSWVVRTANADGFGHEHPADRWASLVLARDTFGRLPRHVRPRALGVLRPSGQRVTVPDGTPFLVTEYVEGQPYARDLERAAATDRVTPRDLERAERLAQLLADTHAERVDPVLYRRALRDLVGHGEGIFGLTESYDPHDPVAPRPRLQALELNAVRWRWRLLERTERARRTHGDFHPFNVLFDDSNAVHLLDASRGGAGEPADDLCALSINYLFFALRVGVVGLGRQHGAEIVAVEVQGGLPPGGERGQEPPGDRRLAAAGAPDEPHDEAGAHARTSSTRLGSKRAPLSRRSPKDRSALRVAAVSVGYQAGLASTKARHAKKGATTCSTSPSPDARR